MFAECIDKTGCCHDSGPLRRAAHACSTAQNDEWGYSCQGLQFTIEPPRQTLPANAPRPLVLRVSSEFVGICNDSSHDSFRSMAVNFEVVSDAGPEQGYLSWHFDRHIDGANPSHELHPRYHFQHGGHRTKANARDLGHLLIMAPPRLPHPPMDALLAVDFALSHFSPLHWKALKQDQTYVNLIKDAQLRLWRPYMAALSTAWDGSMHHANGLDLWPNLVLD